MTTSVVLAAVQTWHQIATGQVQLDEEGDGQGDLGQGGLQQS